MPSHWYGIPAAIFRSARNSFCFFAGCIAACVRDIAANHLLHIYDALHKIAAAGNYPRRKRPWSASWTSTAIANATVDSTEKSIVIPSGAGDFFFRVRFSNASAFAVEVLFGIARFLPAHSNRA